jgi:hypothetical protein
MVNARNDVDFTGLHPKRATYKSDGVDIVYSETQANGSAVVGRAAMISAHKTVRLCGNGDPVRGELERVERDGNVVVNTSYVVLPGGEGAALTPGKKIVGALGAGGARGYIREAASAADALVARGCIIDSSDPAAVVVDLGC